MLSLVVRSLSVVAWGACLIASTAVADKYDAQRATLQGKDGLVMQKLPDGPDWFERCSGVDALADAGQQVNQSVLLRLQEDRLDGTDLLTLRYALDGDGVFRTFLGAGLGRSEYYAEDLRSTDIPLSLRGRRTTLGAAAEVGGEWSLGDQVRFNASARWAELAQDARALRTDHGPVVAQPVVLAVSFGYRFR
jgi:hypothetical protein